MPIPALNDRGLLPPGIHPCALDELPQRFGTFRRSDRRVQLFRRLDQLIGELRRSGLFSSVVIDGSFVTGKAEPEDVDLIVTLRRDHDWSADLSSADYALVSRSGLRRRFGFDVFLAIDGGKDFER